jgi:hypothetical protein
VKGERKLSNGSESKDDFKEAAMLCEKEMVSEAWMRNGRILVGIGTLVKRAGSASRIVPDLHDMFG